MVETGKWFLLRGSARDRNATVYQIDVGPNDHSGNFLVIDGGKALHQLDDQMREPESGLNYTLTRVGDGSLRSDSMTASPTTRP